MSRDVKRKNDIIGFLVIPESGGVLNIAAATVKEEIVKETLDPAKDAVIEMNAANPQLITAPTRKGLVAAGWPLALRSGISVACSCRDGVRRLRLDLRRLRRELSEMTALPT